MEKNQLKVNPLDELSKYDLTIVEVFSKWCPHCKMLTPLVEELEDNYPMVHFIYMNLDEFKKELASYHIENVPALFFFQKDKLVDTHIGYIPYEEIEEKIQFFQQK
jgi:thioredoxin 1